MVIKPSINPLNNKTPSDPFGLQTNSMALTDPTDITNKMLALGGFNGDARNLQGPGGGLQPSRLFSPLQGLKSAGPR